MQGSQLPPPAPTFRELECGHSPIRRPFLPKNLTKPDERNQQTNQLRISVKSSPLGEHSMKSLKTTLGTPLNQTNIPKC